MHRLDVQLEFGSLGESFSARFTFVVLWNADVDAFLMFVQLVLGWMRLATDAAIVFIQILVMVQDVPFEVWLLAEVLTLVVLLVEMDTFHVFFQVVLPLEALLLGNAKVGTLDMLIQLAF